MFLAPICICLAQHRCTSQNLKKTETAAVCVQNGNKSCVGDDADVACRYALIGTGIDVLAYYLVYYLPRLCSGK